MISFIVHFRYNKLSYVNNWGIIGELYTDEMRAKNEKINIWSNKRPVNRMVIRTRTKEISC
ncbi:hypothetical protein GCM10011384_14200 [Psychrobacillus lasiicapitis]|nr:hypothetical protein GCM10011384_14200 [Psychrobacillus lasiicapitis]